MNKWLFFLVVLGIGLVIGCNREGPQPANTTDPKGTEPYVKINQEKIKKDMEAYQKKTEATLKDFEDQLADLKGKASKAGAATKTKMDLEIKELNQKREIATKKLIEIKSATVENWPEVKSHMDAALEELKKGFDKAVSIFQ